MSSIDIYTPKIHTSKHCNKCNIEKSITDFYKCKSTKDGLQTKCKSCSNQYNQTNKDSINIRLLENKDSIKKFQKEYYQTNKKSRKEYKAEYLQTNKPTYNARNAKRRATKLKATPNWTEFDLINQLYIDCILISEMTNIKHNVDHIVPLQSEIVCGLHVLANLQILSETENKSKSNSYWPDMP